MKLSTLHLVAAAAAAVFGSALAQGVDVADIRPDCGGAPWQVQGDACVATAASLAALTTDQTCQGPGLKWNATTSACELLPGEVPQPRCGDAIPNLVVRDGRCVIDRRTSASAPGDYVGDCFRVVAAPDATTLGFRPGQHLTVLSQQDDGDDRLLTVTGATPTFFNFFCAPRGGAIKTVKASDLNTYGAQRLGWTYGLLSLPFKYYAHDKSFAASGSLGPYVGRRSGAAGSAITFAGAATLGSVKGEIRDADGNVTSTPDLLALSLAMGWMFDISKAQGVQPFKVGLFFGVDLVSADSEVKYANNHKPWLAFQIGFDFTDH